MSPRLPEFAPAKVNLCLRITGRRADGYHLLDSLAVFADVGDTLWAEPADTLALTIGGPFGAALVEGADNLVLRAARALAAAADVPAKARLHLEKHLPVASGIGGGSADAAAALRLLARLWRVEADLPAIALGLGADVPVCLASTPSRMQGIGERLAPVALPKLGIVLANPGIGVSTRAVFAGLDAIRAAAVPLIIPETLESLLAWLKDVGNDLQTAAIKLCPAIEDVLAALGAAPECRLAAMSGSGATCFAITDHADAARAAAARLATTGLWVWGGGLADRD